MLTKDLGSCFTHISNRPEMGIHQPTDHVFGTNVEHKHHSWTAFSALRTQTVKSAATRSLGVRRKAVSVKGCLLRIITLNTHDSGTAPVGDTSEVSLSGKRTLGTLTDCLTTSVSGELHFITWLFTISNMTPKGQQIIDSCVSSGQQHCLTKVDYARQYEVVGQVRITANASSCKRVGHCDYPKQ
jgi:hypothetical protein